jgi:hypothetical protein
MARVPPKKAAAKSTATKPAAPKKPVAPAAEAQAPAAPPASPIETLAKNNPVFTPTQNVTSEELTPAPEKTVSFDNGIRQEAGSEIILERDAINFDEKAAILAFMEEPVKVIISDDSGKNPEKYIYLAVNGRGAGPNGIPWVPRGVEITVKRKFLNVLAGARQVKYTNYEEVNSEGERQSKQRATANDRYPFSVVEDLNPRGIDWLRQLRATNRAG